MDAFGGQHSSAATLARQDQDPPRRVPLLFRVGTVVGAKQSAYIDIIDKGILKCPSCFRGVQYQRNTSRAMLPDLLRRVAEKLKREHFSAIGFYNWTKTAALQVARYLRKDRQGDRFACNVSTNLSLPPKSRSLAFAQILDRYRAILSGRRLIVFESAGWSAN